MPAAHDRGGWPDETPIDRDEHLYSDWERRVDAVHQALGAQGIRTTDEMRRAIESLPPERYEALSYYEKWTAALEILLIEKGILTGSEIDAKAAELRRQGL
jgi:nitrile hydratase